MKISVNYELERDDVFKASAFYYSKIGIGFMRLVLGAMMCAMGVAIMSNNPGFGLLFIFSGVIQFYSPRISAWMITRRYFANPELAGNITIEADKTELKSTSRAGDGALKWEEFTRWLESNEAFLLILYKGNFLIIPKKAFADEARINEFRDLIKEKIVRRKYAKKDLQDNPADLNN